MLLAFYFYQQIDEDDFNEEQNSVARLIHMLYNDDPEEMLKVISISNAIYLIYSFIFKI